MEYRIEAIERISRLPSNLPHKQIELKGSNRPKNSIGKTFEDYLNECRKFNKPIIHVDTSKTVDKIIPYINIPKEIEEFLNVDIVKVKMAYEGEIIEKV